MEWIDLISSLLALIVLEVVLGIDNLVFLAVLTERLPRQDRKRARRWGLTFAWVTRLMLLTSAVWIVGLKTPLFHISSLSFSVRDLFLLLGGGFLIAKSTQEIHYEVEPSDKYAFQSESHAKDFKKFHFVILQVGIMDIIFSLDSVLTAVGLTSSFLIMALAITVAILVMIWASEPVSAFIEEHPTIKMLALSFLILIGAVLIADGLSFHVPRGYIYFAMGFSLSVEVLNHIKQKRRRLRKNRS